MQNHLQPLPPFDTPIFWENGAAYTLFYAPGCAVVTAPGAAGDFARTLSGRGALSPWGTTLRDHAARALDTAARQQAEPFQPECLTLYLHNECNLACAYCYTDPAYGPAARLDPEAVVAAGRQVAENCRHKGLPLTVVFHGGGEPLLFEDQVQRTLAALGEVAAAYDLELFRYVATNGVMPAPKAAWLADHFDLVGLSCDGPPEIQDRQRARYGGGPTSATLERTARILRAYPRPFHVRATITAATLHRQSEIADYICTHLQPDEIHFEPVYSGGKTESAIQADQAEAFVSHFLAAQRAARQAGVPLTCSGSRLGSIHGPFCQVLRHVLNLVPPATATACFKTTDTFQAEAAGNVVGALNTGTGEFEIDHRRVEALRQRLGAVPNGCADCFNRYHCARDCPDSCLLGDDLPSPEPGFRCRVQNRLAYTRIRQEADALWSAAQANGMDIHGTTSF
jgi:uncharacterized protein